MENKQKNNLYLQLKIKKENIFHSEMQQEDDHFVFYLDGINPDVFEFHFGPGPLYHQES
jgi:hypothetical protein